MREIWVYTQKESPRLSYVLDFIKTQWGIPFYVTIDEPTFEDVEAAKINYTHKKTVGIQVPPQKLLFETEVKLFDFTNLEHDYLAMIFFLLTRYEEYVVEDRDEYDRFPSSASYLAKTNRLNLPWVDVLIENLKKSLLDKYPSLKFKEKQAQKQLTIDIDQAYLYKNKGFKRFVGANLRDALKFDFKTIVQRKLTYFGFKKDPWDVYAEVKSWFDKTDQQPIVFFQVGDYGEFDKNVHYQNSGFRHLIQRVAKWAEIGLHPSYQSNVDMDALKEEKNRLGKIVHQAITKSRQHFIKLNIPTTYYQLLSIGITDDYSMGFPDDVGFRAGTAHTFNWYDLNNETVTDLRIHPFCAMDVTLKNYLMLSPAQAIKLLNELYQTIAHTGGCFRLICHNESLSGYQEWKEWDEMLKKFILA